MRRTTKIAVATKTDLADARADRRRTCWTSRSSARETDTDWAEIVPVSAQVRRPGRRCWPTSWSGCCPRVRSSTPTASSPTAPEETIVAELIREAALDGVRDELPHSIAVVVEEMGLREGRPEDKPLLDIHANLFVERSSQKGIVIGHRGSRLRAVGTAARHQIEAMLGTPVYLDLHVKVAKDWQKDPRQLRRLGF